MLDLNAQEGSLKDQGGVCRQREVTLTECDIYFGEMASWVCVKIARVPVFHHQETPFINLPPYISQFDFGHLPNYIC